MKENVKRLLACDASDFLTMNKDELLQSIYAAEGRTIMAEVNVNLQNAPFNVTNAEIARAFSADLILLNKCDLNEIQVAGMPESPEPIKKLRELTGRPIGTNLEPIDLEVKKSSLGIEEIKAGRLATIENLKKAQAAGFDFILLTGNPASGVTNHQITLAVQEARQHFQGIIIAGKMHSAGVNEDFYDLLLLDSFIDSGADIVLLPAPGTTPGSTVERLSQATAHIQKRGKLVIAANGSGQECADTQTIKDIGLWSKMAGVDIHHIGATGYAGMAPYENIYELSLAVRGLRHTVHMMAKSIKR